MKNKIICIFFGLLLLSSCSSTYPVKKEIGIKAALSDLGKFENSFDDIKQYTLVPDGKFAYATKYDKVNLSKYPHAALYYTGVTPLIDEKTGVLNQTAVIFVEVKDDEFLVKYQDLPKGKYKLTGFSTAYFTLTKEQGFKKDYSAALDVLVFRKIES